MFGMNLNDTPTQQETRPGGSVEAVDMKGLLGRYPISRSTVYQLLPQGLPVLRISSRKLIFPVPEVDHWMRNRFLVGGGKVIR